MASMETSITLGKVIMVPIQDCRYSNGYALESDGNRFVELIPKTVTFWKKAMVIGASQFYNSHDKSTRLVYRIQLGQGEVEVPEEAVVSWQEEFYGVNWRTDMRKDGSGGKPTLF